MVLLSYMLSPDYCGYLKMRGQNRMGLIGQVTKIVRNVMFLMVLIDTLKRRELYGSIQKIKLHGYNIVKGGQNHIGMSLKMGSIIATFSIKQCSKLSDHLHHVFLKGHLREMNEPSDK
eukprot:13267833-Ditylum_brightwellii.AAC.1